MDIIKLRKKNNFLITILLILVLMILVCVVCFFRLYLSGEFECECANECEIEDNDIIIDNTINNDNYLGIYNYEDISNEKCISNTTLILNSDFSAIFYIGDCNSKSYYLGKYKLEDKKIVLYSVILQDSNNNEEIKIEDEVIYFNISNHDSITSIYGRSESVILNKLYNVI